MPAFLKKIELHNFKTFNSLEIEFEGYETLIGRNGIGKSTILDAINLLSSSNIPSQFIKKGTDEDECSIIFTLEVDMSFVNHSFWRSAKGVVILEINSKSKKILKLSPKFIPINFGLLLKDKFKGIQLEQGQRIITRLKDLGYNYAIYNDSVDTIRTNFENNYPVYFHLIMLKENTFDYNEFHNTFEELHQIDGISSYINIRFKDQKVATHDFLNQFSTYSQDLINMISKSYKPIYLDHDFGINQLQRTYSLESVESNLIRDLIETKTTVKNFLKGSNQGRIKRELNEKVNSILKEFELDEKPEIHFDSAQNLFNIDVFIDNESFSPTEINLGLMWMIKFIIKLCAVIKNEKTNFIVLIDEPGFGVHQKVQYRISQNIKQIAILNQVIFTTHHPKFIDYNDLMQNVIMLQRSMEDSSKIIPKSREDPFFIANEIHELLPSQIPEYFMMNNYSTITLENIDYITQLDSIQKLQAAFLDPKLFNKLWFTPESNQPNHEVIYRIYNKTEVEKLVNLGTFREKNLDRIIHDSGFMTTPVLDCNLNESDNNIPLILKNIFIVQLNKIDDGASLNRQQRFIKVAQCWNENITEANIDSIDITYTPQKITIINEKIEKVLIIIKNNLSQAENEIDLIVFPETSIPLDIFPMIKNFCQEHNVICIGGLEHQKANIWANKDLFDDPQFFNKPLLMEIIYNLKTIPNPNPTASNLPTLCPIENFAFIINGNQKWGIQLKNNPVVGKKFVEKIPIRFNQFFFKFNTQIGKLAVMICKDFLVNYNVIPQWLNLHDIKYFVIPSFTETVTPFLQKLQKFAHHEQSKPRMYIYANIAEYGGSRVFCTSNIGNFEPTSQEEKYLIDNWHKERVFLFQRTLLEDKKNFYPFKNEIGDLT